MTRKPIGWTSTTLGEACFVNPPKPDVKVLPDDTAVTFVPMTAVDEGSGAITEPQTRTLGEVRDKSYQVFAPGDVIFAKITPCMENGKFAVVPDLGCEIVYGSTEFHVLRPRVGTNARYIWHFLRQPQFRKIAADNMTGSVGQARVPVGFLREFHFELPPEDVQEQMSAWLDEVLGGILNVSDSVGGAREKLEATREAVLALACSGRMTAAWREGRRLTSISEALSSVVGAGAKRRKGTGSSFDGELAMPELPDHFVLSTIGEAAQRIDYGVNRKLALSGAVPVLRMSNVQRGVVDVTDLKYSEEDDEVRGLLLDPGDLLFNRTNSPELVGKSAVFEGRDETRMSFASYLVRVRFHADVALPHYVNYWIESAWGRAWARYVKTDGVSQSNINATKLAQMPLPLPPIDEQREIVHRASGALDGLGEISRTLSEVQRSVTSARTKSTSDALRLQATEV